MLMLEDDEWNEMKKQHKESRERERKWEATEANKFAAISWEKAFSFIHCVDGMKEDSGVGGCFSFFIYMAI